MTARLPIDGTPALSDYKLTDNLSATSGRIFLTGTQALVRILLAQRGRARAERAGCARAPGCRSERSVRWWRKDCR